MFPNQALKNILDYFGNTDGRPLTYHLFKNNHTVVAGTLLSDLTESDFDGYAALSAVTEGAASIVAGPEAESLGPELIWETDDDLGTPQQAFGVYVTFQDATNTAVLFFAANFDAPITLAFEGDQVKKKVNLYTKDFAP